MQLDKFGASQQSYLLTVIITSMLINLGLNFFIKFKPTRYTLYREQVRKCTIVQKSRLKKKYPLEKIQKP